MPLPEQEFHPDVLRAEETYQQPFLTGIEAELPEPITLENCLVTVSPSYTRRGKTRHWHCSFAAEPDIFHPDRDELVEVRTTDYAVEAHGKHLQPGDRVSITGIHQQGEVELANGEKKTIQYVLVSEIHVLSRAKRMHTTVFDRHHK